MTTPFRFNSRPVRLTFASAGWTITTISKSIPRIWRFCFPAGELSRRRERRRHLYRRSHTRRRRPGDRQRTNLYRACRPESHFQRDGLIERRCRRYWRADQFDTWAYGRDHRYDVSRSAQYLSPDVVGFEDLDDQRRLARRSELWPCLVPNTEWQWAGLLITTATGTGLNRGDTHGWMTRRGDTRRFTMDAG